MKRIILLLLLLHDFYALYAQDGMQLEKQLISATTDTGKMTLLRQLAIKNRQENMPLSMRYAGEGLTLARKVNDPARIGAFYSVLANNYIQEANYAQAKLYLDSAYLLFQRKADRKGMANTLSSMGGLYQRQSDLVTAIRYFKKAYAMAEAAGDQRAMFLSTYNTAITYCDQHNGKMALEYAQKAYGMVQKNKDEAHLGISLATLAEAYRLLDDTANAEQYFAKAKTEFEHKGDEYGVASVLTNWALIQRDPARELEMEIQAQEYWDKSGTEDLMVIANLGNLGAKYYKLYRKDIYNGKYGDKTTLLQKAGTSLERSLAMAQKFGSGSYQPEPLKTLAYVQYARGNYKSAFENLEQATRLNDSIFSQENKNKIAALESQQKIDLRDKEIRIGKLALAAERKQRIALLIGIALLLLLGFMFYRQARNRKKANAKLLQLNAELEEANRLKASFFGILSHDLRSPVARLVSFLRLQKESPEMLNEEMKVQYEGRIRTAAENLLDTMESVLAWSKGQMQHFTPKPEPIIVDDLFHYVIKHFEEVHDLNIIFRNPEKLVLHSDPEFVKTIMRNFTDNAAKAVKYNTEPMIVWTAGHKNGRPFLSIEDNGPGAKEEQLKALFDEKAEVIARNGLGFHLIRDLAKAIHCKIEADIQEEGTTFYLLF